MGEEEDNIFKKMTIHLDKQLLQTHSHMCGYFKSKTKFTLLWEDHHCIHL